MERAC